MTHALDQPPPPDDTLRAEIKALWAEHGLSTADFSLDQAGTLGGPTHRQTTGRAAFASAMPATIVARPVRRAAVDDDVEAAPVTQGELIAAGGMGLVHEGHQRSLRRQVAVKTLKPEVDNPDGVDALLREAWLVGNLEHPNIVPIHLLDTAGGCSPRMVMKRIDGTTWAQLLKDPEVARAYGAEDLLEFHLRILIQVCQAVRYAHSRGIVHLDIKPDNVMAGHYDEVYLVDWGLAVSFAEHCETWLPHVSQMAAVCGTPGYIAPEMVSADRASIGPRTDVYLLGAVLHEIISGSRRHAGEGVQDTLVNAYVSAATVYDDTVPSELGRIANIATARLSEDRYPDVAAFRQAVEAFLDHRVSTDLSAATTARLESVVSSQTTVADTEEDTRAHQRQLLEARFGYRQALSIWSANEAARDGLQGLLVTMAERAIADGNADAAADLLDEMPIQVPTLADAVAELRSRQASDAAEVETLRRDHDHRIHGVSRSRVALVAGVGWLVWNAGVAWLHKSGTVVMKLPELLWMNLLTVAIFAGLLFVVRKTLMTTKVNRAGMFLLGAGQLCAAGIWAMGDLAGLDVLTTVSFSLILYPMTMIALGLVLDLTVAWAALFVTPLCFLAPAYPTYAFECAGIAGFIAGMWGAFIWRRQGRRTSR